jgi:hypothetical protein
MNAMLVIAQNRRLSRYEFQAGLEIRVYINRSIVRFVINQ